MNTRNLIFAFIVIVIALLLHQFIYYDVWFEMADLHHETWIVMFAFAAFVLYISKRGKI